MDIKKAWVINLDERKDRYDEFCKEKFPFEVERFPAIKNHVGRTGCLQSHLAILKKNNPLPFAVFEDDCKMIQPWSVVQDAMEELPDDADMLYIGANLNGPIQGYSEHLNWIRDAWTTHAIIYNSQRVVEYVLKKGKKIDYEIDIDIIYAKDVCYKFNCFITRPLCAVQRKSDSNIVYGYRDYEKLFTDNYKKYSI